MRTKPVYLIVAFAFLLTELNAQIAVGLKSGVNFNRAHSTELLGTFIPDFRYTPGLTAGVVAEAEFGRYFSVQPEFTYTQRGFRWNESTGIPIGDVEIPVGADVTFRTHYLEIPVLAKLRLGNETVAAYFATGPQVGYAVDAGLITRPRLFFELDPIRTNVDLESLGYERWEFSGVGAAGVQFKFKGLKWYLEGRYTLGFSELYDFPLVNEKIKHHSFAVTSGLLFDLGDR